MWNPDEYVQRLLANAQTTPAVARTADPGKSSFGTDRSTFLRAKLVEALGSFPHEASDLAIEWLERTERDDYYEDRVAYTASRHLRVPAYVLVPKRLDGKVPAVVAWHGHGFGSREIVGLRPDGTRNEGDTGIHRRFAVELVKRGMIVLAPETIGFGDRRLLADMEKDPQRSSSCFSLATKLLMIGRTLAGLRVFEAVRALDYLVSRDDVNPARIGCMGFSGGGLVAAFAAAVDERIRATVLCAYASTFRGSILSVPHCIDNYIPGILGVAELPELIGLIAPRALFVESGTEDPLFPVDSVREAVAGLDAIYRKAGAPERFASDLFPGTHEISGRVSYDWLAGQLLGESGE